MHSFFYLFPRLTGAFLNPAKQFVFLAFDVFKIVVGKLGPLLFEFAFGDVPIAFDFQCVHKFVWLLFDFC